jgi:hypothetical protein
MADRLTVVGALWKLPVAGLAAGQQGLQLCSWLLPGLHFPDEHFQFPTNHLQCYMFTCSSQDAHFANGGDSVAQTQRAIISMQISVLRPVG